jgi:transcription antitermination protein NusB
MSGVFPFEHSLVICGSSRNVLQNMLNRRTLRIKIMQSLFAFEQCKEANHQLALDQVEEYFVPDLNSMEFQDKDLLKAQRREARELLEKHFEKSGDVHESGDKAINTAVKSSLSFYYKQVKADFLFFSKNLVSEVEKIGDHYFSVLGLLASFSETAAADKKGDFANFATNLWLRSLLDHPVLKASLLKKNSGWHNRQDKVRGWFRDILRNDSEFKKYNALKQPTDEEQKLLLKHLVRKVILGKTIIQDYFEEEDIRWAEDKDIVRSLVDKTIKSKEDAGGAIELQKLSLDWEDDKLFMDKLFANSVELDPAYKDLISQNTKNWEVDRLPLTDRIMLEMAIAELITFSGIPVKVTINEYIELAKIYSTPKSRQFINGILDVIAKDLQHSGVVKKSGRGLIDNK